MSQDRTHLLNSRRSGVLLHPTSLPGPQGSGDFGPAAYHFVDWLVKAGQSLWQVLPLNPVGPGNSPYQSVSTFAGSPLLVDLASMVERGWLRWEPDPGYERRRCDFARVAPRRMERLRTAWQGFSQTADAAEREEFAAFCVNQSHWLDDYAMFMTLDGLYGHAWNLWPGELALRVPEALQRLRQERAQDIEFWSFVQWQFMAQWQGLRKYANRCGIFIVGDAPIFVAHHSADVWANPSQFLLDAAGLPSVVAGVPPDYFSPTGQRWGNPLYNWPAMQADGYAWWRSRLAHQLNCVDVLRLDHFRGFESYWEVPAQAANAVQGQWCEGPGKFLFDALLEALGPLPLIAEDLGLITPAVDDLRLHYGFPGMRILQFAFGDTPGNPYLPHNYQPQTVAYAGTHDNNTAVGWWQGLDRHQREAVVRYLGPEAQSSIHWAMIRAISQSVATTVVHPFGDVLGLDGSHRMNVPGQAEGCWEWRFEWSQVGDAAGVQLAQITQAHGRCP
jgi:4-alpha-glucanotransferase